MALSGSFYTNVNDHWRLQLEWSATQNISANQSTVTAKLYWMATDGYGAVNSSATKDGTVWIDGTAYTFSGAGLADLNGNQKRLLTTKSRTITHSADGKLDVTFDAVFNAEVTLSGTYYGGINLTAKTYSLNTIPRASSLSSSANWTAGSDLTVSVSRASSSFSHEAEISVLRADGVYDWIKQVAFTTSQTSKGTAFTTDEKEEIFRHLAGRSSAGTRIVLQTFSGSTMIGEKTYTGTVTAPNASTVKVSNPAGVSDLAGQESSTVWIDQSIGINVTRYDSEFTHTLRFKDSNDGTIIKEVTGVTTAYTWIPTQAEKDLLYAKIPNAKELDGQVDVLTYYGSELVRSATAMDINYRVRNSNPTFAGTDVSYIDTNTGTSTITGDNTKIVQGISTVKVTIPVANKATALNKSTMKSYIAVLNGVQKTATYSATADITFDFGTINAGTDQVLTVKAVDSRGFETPITKTVSMIPYASPTLNASAKRKNGFENSTTLLANGSISPVTINGVPKNTVSDVKYRYRKSTEATSVVTWAVYKSMAETVSNQTYVTTAEVLDFDNTFTYYVDFLVIDGIGGSRLVSLTVGSGKPILFIDAIKKAVGIGKFSTNFALDVAGDTNIDGKVIANSLRIKSTGDASPTSTGHGLTVGDDLTGYAIKIDNNEIIATNEGLAGDLHLATDGGRVTFNNNVSGLNLVIEGGQITNEGTHQASLVNGWVNYAGAYTNTCYWKDKNGVVHITGLPKDGAVSTVIFTLPAGYRPYETEIFYVNSGTGNARVDVRNDGTVYCNFATATTSWVSLAGISFKAEK